MIVDFALVFGGVGLFLAGMLILTEGLRALAGGSLRRLLSKYTKSPASGALTGALTTAFLQSSSATTVTAVGFVGAGLLTFPQSLGIIFGANIGTTLTGWLVALLGFKVKLGTLVLPLILVGVILRLYGAGTAKNIGWALVGFSLLFVGIATMQQGASGFEGALSPSVFPPDTLFGRLQLVGIGIAVTLITQSSSAGIAAAMVALASGAISFPQAAAMVIGMDVGTTFTAALATVGGSTPVRRTGYAHVIYNVLTGIMAFFFLGPVTMGLEALSLTGNGSGSAQVGLALFHTFFNFMGVLLVLPFTKKFARLVKWLVPEESPALVSLLDKHLLKEPGAATDAVIFTVRKIRKRLLHYLDTILAHQSAPSVLHSQLAEIDMAVRAVRAYAQSIKTEAGTTDHLRLVEAMHALDHLRRLHQRCMRSDLRAVIGKDWRLQRLSGLLRRCVHKAGGEPVNEPGKAPLAKLNRLMLRQDSTYRKRMMEKVSGGGKNGEKILERLDAMRWLLRVSYHVWRIQIHIEPGQ